jgi:uncharacterized repeat protein (TIGR03847 family)
MRSLGRVEHLAAGAMGPPGHRTFYLELDGPQGREWFLVEKEQLAAMATHGLELAGAGSAEPGPALSEPGGPTFRVGEIGLGSDGEEIVVVLSPAEEGEPVAFTVSQPDFAAMARRALAVVAAGRPRCRFCGLPEDPEGHTCPAGNGDLRRQ